VHEGHRHQEFIRFLNVIEARVPKKKTIHVIVDNYATHKHPDVMQWLDKLNWSQLSEQKFRVDKWSLCWG
jgi:ABC-type proline/glycine betaine transport system substrate-binding protein